MDAEDGCYEGNLILRITFWGIELVSKWLFTSWTEFHAIPRISVDLALSVPFIREHTERRVTRIPHMIHSGLGTSVVDRVTEGAEGLWLYARLMMDEIAEAPSRELVDQYLQNLLCGLAGIYTRILQTQEI